MDWVVLKNANTDAEREHLNKILKDIRASLNGEGGSVTTIGETGPRGPKGDTGATGSSSTDLALIPASENLLAGDFVNVYNDTTQKVRKADASVASAAKLAHGYVLQSVTSPNNATVHFEGTNNMLSGLTPGLTYALSHSTPGGVIVLSMATYTTGHILQVLGKAISSTEINVEIDSPVERA